MRNRMVKARRASSEAEIQGMPSPAEIGSPHYRDWPHDQEFIVHKDGS